MRRVLSTRSSVSAVQPSASKSMSAGIPSTNIPTNIAMVISSRCWTKFQARPRTTIFTTTTSELVNTH
jgi:hypothetical protein